MKPNSVMLQGQNSDMGNKATVLKKKNCSNSFMHIRNEIISITTLLAPLNYTIDGAFHNDTYYRGLNIHAERTSLERVCILSLSTATRSHMISPKM